MRLEVEGPDLAGVIPIHGHVERLAHLLEVAWIASFTGESPDAVMARVPKHRYRAQYAEIARVLLAAYNTGGVVELELVAR